MILMRMTNQHRRRSAAVERYRQQTGGAFWRVQRTPGIENDAITVRMRYFNAASADLLRTAMNR